jgi:hypothetical protein
MLKVYKCKPFENTHENNMSNELIRLLEIQFKNSPTSVLLFINYRNLDMLLIKSDAILILEMKDFGGNLLEIPKEGAWKIADIEVKGGAHGKNPYQQVAAAKWKLAEEFGKLPLFSNIELKHINGVVVFNHSLEKSKEVKDAERAMCWFKVTDMDNIGKVIANITSSKIALSDDDLGNIPTCLKVESALQSVSADPKLLEKQLREAKATITALNEENIKLSGAIENLQIVTPIAQAASDNTVANLEAKVNELQHKIAAAEQNEAMLKAQLIDNQTNIAGIPVQVTEIAPPPAKRSYGAAAMFACLFALLLFGIFAFKDIKEDSKTLANDLQSTRDSIKQITEQKAAELTQNKPITNPVSTVLIQNPLTNSAINLRKTPSVKSAKAGSIAMPTECTFLTKSSAMETLKINNDFVTDYWYNIEYNGKSVWVFGYYVSK